MAAITRDGSIRKLWMADSAAFRDHLLRLDAASRRDRFGMEADDDFVCRYAENSFWLDTVIHGIFVGGALVGVAELRMIGTSRSEAEAAFSVESEWRGRGFGTRLMEQVMLTARNRRIRKLYMNCLAGNPQALRLAEHSGAELVNEGDDVIGLIVPTTPSPQSYLREVVRDGYGWAVSMAHLQRRAAGSGRFGRAAPAD